MLKDNNSDGEYHQPPGDTPKDWVESDAYGYRSECCNPREYNIECSKCEAELSHHGGRSGSSVICPNHGVVFSL